MRQDWLKKVGKELPKTLDEMLDVARAFKEAKLGGEDTVGLGMFNSNANYDYRGILAAYGAVYGTWMEQVNALSRKPNFFSASSSEKLQMWKILFWSSTSWILIEPDAHS